MNRLIAAGAAFYGGLGILALARPEQVPATFGGTAPTADARTEVRAVYGGLPLAIAATLVASPSSATAMGVLTGGMAIWAYLAVFHYLHGRTKRIWYEDGRGERVLVAAHG